jgi:hypothetical protein
MESHQLGKIVLRLQHPLEGFKSYLKSKSATSASSRHIGHRPNAQQREETFQSVRLTAVKFNLSRFAGAEINRRETASYDETG